ncbi:MAG: inner membrane CreD family protein, partial [Bacteroidota bacterium]|nr:inner membrane CreD family protein [Bacteroidota bacterium]
METKGIQQFLNSYSVKMIIVSGLAILLLIPSFLIQDVISERIKLSEKVKNELYSQWGGKQVVAGPVLNVPFTIQEKIEKNQGVTERKGIAHFLPEALKTDGSLAPEKRNRGIYEVVVYEGSLKLTGSFVQPDVSHLDIPNAQFNWEAAYFTLGISDMRGIKNLPELVVNGQKCKVDPGVADTDLFQSGITIKANSIDLKQALNFEIELVLNGSEDLSVEALGKTSEVSMKSDWASPSFSGVFLPTDR